MKSIVQAQQTVAAICGSQAATEEPLRWSRHVVFAACPDGLLACHTLTSELVLLSEATDAFATYPDETRRELLVRWFLVPESFDERRHADQVRKVFELLHPFDATITRYTILTTTACNARCPYCYEAGVPHDSMSAGTAEALAAFIVRQCAGKKAHLRWFGGEPLVNARAIDIICGALRDAGVEYTSQITSNGYLFDEAAVEAATTRWNIKIANITLDGAEDVYNRTKAYVGVLPGTSPYRRVLANIGSLLDAGIRVSLRINLGPENQESVAELIDELEGLFAHRSGFYAYVAALHDFTQPGPPPLGGRETLEAAVRFRDLLEKKGLGGWAPLEGGWGVNRCMADRPDAVSVMPDGRFGRCEHYSQGEDLVGSMAGEDLDQDVLASWREVVRVPACDGCPLYPSCRRLVLCPWDQGRCTEERRWFTLERMRKSMLATWRMTQ